jgi:hypothetical protein
LKTEISRLHNTIALMRKDWLELTSEIMNNLYRSEEASARGDAALIVISLFFAGLLVVAFTSNPIATGTKPGERAPLFSGKAYNGDGWETFVFDDLLTPEWTPNSTDDAPWIAVEFMDRLCGHCVSAASEVGDWSETYVKTSNWPGPDVLFVAVHVEFQGSSSRADIEDFRDSNGHTFPYFDDDGVGSFKDWDIGATPTYFLVQPNGIVAWNSGIQNLAWDAVSEESITIGDPNGDQRVKLNEAIEQITLSYGGATE